MDGRIPPLFYKLIGLEKVNKGWTIENLIYV